MTATTPTETRKRHLTDANVEEKPLLVRELIREWCKDDTATEAQLERLDDYVRAGIMEQCVAGEVRYKWFRKGAFTEPGSWDEWTHMIETQDKKDARKWRAYQNKSATPRKCVVKKKKSN